MATRIYEKRPGAWHLDIRLPDGRRLRPYAGSTEAEAERQAPLVTARALGAPEKVEKAQPAPTPAVHKAMTFEEAYKLAGRTREKWLLSKDPQGTRGKVYGKVVTKWGASNPVTVATHAAVKEWRGDMLREGLAPSTINHRLSMLTVLQETAEIQPHGVKHLSVKGNERTRRTPNQEIMAVVQWCRNNQHRAGALTLADKVVVGLGLAARSGELKKLRWTDVQFSQEGYRGRVTLRGTKNGKTRVNLMSARVEEVLKARKDAGHTSPFGALSDSQHAALWRDARKALGLEEDAEFVFHVATRHEGLSRVGEQSASAFQIKAFGGHDSIAASDRYVHLDAAEMVGFADGILEDLNLGD